MGVELTRVASSRASVKANGYPRGLSTRVLRDLFGSLLMYFVVLSVSQSVGWSQCINGIGESDLKPLESRDMRTEPCSRCPGALPRDTAAILFSMQENASIIAQARDAPTCDDTLRVST